MECIVMYSKCPISQYQMNKSLHWFHNVGQVSFEKLLFYSLAQEHIKNIAFGTFIIPDKTTHVAS